MHTERIAIRRLRCLEIIVLIMQQPARVTTHVMRALITQLYCSCFHNRGIINNNMRN